MTEDRPDLEWVPPEWVTPEERLDPVYRPGYWKARDIDYQPTTSDAKLSSSLDSEPTQGRDDG